MKFYTYTRTGTVLYRYSGFGLPYGEFLLGALKSIAGSCKPFLNISSLSLTFNYLVETLRGCRLGDLGISHFQLVSQSFTLVKIHPYRK